MAQKNLKMTQLGYCQNLSQLQVMLISNTLPCNAVPSLSTGKHLKVCPQWICDGGGNWACSSQIQQLYVPSLRTGHKSDCTVKFAILEKSHSKKQVVLVAFGSLVPRFMPCFYFPRDWNSVLGQFSHTWTWFLPLLNIPHLSWVGEVRQ